LSSSDPCDRESLSAHKHNENLATNDDELDADEPPILENSFKDVELVVKPTGAVEVSHMFQIEQEGANLLVLVEDLHKHESIEYRAVQLIDLLLRMVVENAFSRKVQDERHNKLEYRLSNNHLPHVERNQWC
jgi:hypothetical protein